LKVLLIYPFSGKWIVAPKRPLASGAYVPPLGILYLAKMIENEGHKVEVLDCNVEGIHPEKILGNLSSYDAIGMTVYSNPNELKNTIMLVERIKEKDPSFPVILGGPHCTILPQHALQTHPADICVQGEAEYRIPKILDAVQGKQELKTIPGIAYRKGSEVLITEPPSQIEDLNQLPFPSRHLVDKYEYGFMHGAKIAKGKVTSLLTSRGCPFHCRYCQISSFLPKFRLRSAENVIAEIDEVISKGYETIIFIDDNFLAHKKRTEEIMDHIIQQKFDVHLWIEGARVDSADHRLYKKLRQAGVEFISFGIESGNQDVLDFYNKKTTLEQIKKAVHLSKEMGFFIYANFILGAPLETKQHLMNTIRFAQKLPIDAAGFFTLGYLYGSDLWQQAVQDGKITSDEYYVTADIQRGLGQFTEQELNDYAMKAYKRFYIRPSLWIRQLWYAGKNQDTRFLKLGAKMLG
jgi:anaerobic magnesium-protoporphyrin IX monomethyl ester cyclase